jgi:Tol biopolymer transport system component
MIEFEPEISSDGLTLFFVSDRPGGSGSYDIWFTKRATTDGSWGKPVNLGPTINSPVSDGGPSLSVDGLALYFNSRRSDGQGGIDIFETTRPTIDAPWSRPVNLGPLVNSPMAEFYPFISSDGLSLFFVSMRWGGLGQGDLYVTTRPTIKDPWSTPINLGPNVNTHNCDEYPEISSDGKYLIFSSNRSGGMGGYDIWQMEISTMSADSLQ